MKNKIILTAFFFVLMAALPLSFAVNRTGSGSSGESEASKTGQNPQTDGYNQDPAAATAALCKPSFSDEAIKAAAIIQKTNIISGQVENISNDISDKELYNRVKSIYNSNTEILFHSDKPVCIPWSPCSNGFTSASEDYDYLEAVASPWDAFSPLYDGYLDCKGVSMNGISYLCSHGLSAEEALSWYLPNLQIKASG